MKYVSNFLYFRLPVDFFQSPFTTRPSWNKSIRFQNYTNCVKRVTKKTKTKKKNKIFAHNCKDYISKSCYQLYKSNNPRKGTCFEKIFGYKQPFYTTNASYFEDIDFLANNKVTENLWANYSHPNIKYREHSNKTAPKGFNAAFFNCMQNNRAISDQCISKLERTCNESNIIGTKVIRMRMYNVAYLLSLNPNIKIIHYVRDPRGVTMSRFTGTKKKKNKDKLMIDTAGKLCKLMLEDIRVRKKLEEKYPENLMLVKYEDLVTKPVQELERIYRFLEIPLPDELTKWVLYSLHANSSEVNTKKPMGAYRKDGVETAFKWQKKMSPRLLQSVTKVCLDAINVIGYPVEISKAH